MFPTVAAVVSTVVFLITGTYALARYVHLGAQPDADRRLAGQARAVELLHLLMSLAMIAMAWGWSGGPETGSGLVQIVVFGAFAVVFVVLAVRARGLAPVVSRSAHALMGAAMVWMVAAMPVLMGHAAGADDAGGAHAGHAGHGASAAMDTGLPAAPAPTWALAVNGVVALLLVASAAYWVVRARQAFTASGRVACAADPSTTPPATPSATTSSPEGTSPGAAGTVATLAPAAVDAPAPTATGRVRGVLAASCHTIMSLGMAAMLLAMT